MDLVPWLTDNVVEVVSTQCGILAHVLVVFVNELVTGIGNSVRAGTATEVHVAARNHVHEPGELVKALLVGVSKGSAVLQDLVREDFIVGSFAAPIKGAENQLLVHRQRSESETLMDLIPGFSDSPVEVVSALRRVLAEIGVVVGHELVFGVVHREGEVVAVEKHLAAADIGDEPGELVDALLVRLTEGSAVLLYGVCKYFVVANLSRPIGRAQVQRALGGQRTESKTLVDLVPGLANLPVQVVSALICIQCDIAHIIGQEIVFRVVHGERR